MGAKIKRANIKYTYMRFIAEPSENLKRELFLLQKISRSTVRTVYVGDTIKMCNKILLDFYPGLPHHIHTGIWIDSNYISSNLGSLGVILISNPNSGISGAQSEGLWLECWQPGRTRCEFVACSSLIAIYRLLFCYCWGAWEQRSKRLGVSDLKYMKLSWGWAHPLLSAPPTHATAHDGAWPVYDLPLCIYVHAHQHALCTHH